MRRVWTLTMGVAGSISMAALAAGAGCASPSTALSSPAFRATVHVGTKVINTLRPEIFGDNIEWANEGMGFWNPENKSLDPNLVGLTKQAGVTHLRYPGGTLSDYFHWQWAIGDYRTPIPNPFDNGKAARPDFGPDEVMDLCRRLGAKAYITLNAGTGTPEEAAAWVRYNEEHHYPVSAYEIGNEIYMANTPVPGVPVDKSPEEYIAFYNAAYRQIRQVSPRAKVGAIGVVDTGVFPLERDPTWIGKILKGLGPEIDFLAIHNSYAPGLRRSGVKPWAERYPDDVFAGCMLAAPVSVARNIAATESFIERTCPKDAGHIDLHITESGPLVLPIDKAHIAEDVTWNTNLTGALYEAGFFNMVAREPKVTSVNHLPLCQNYFGALIGIDTTAPQHHVWRNIVYHVFRMYSSLAGSKVLSTAVDSPTYDVPVEGLVPATKGVPLIDATTFRDGRRHLHIMLINRSVSRDSVVTVDAGLKGYWVLKVTTLTSASFTDRNTKDDPNRVLPVSKAGPATVLKKAYVVVVPKHALVEVEMKAL